MYSIFHLFKSLVQQKDYFAVVQKLEDFPFDSDLLSCKNVGQFPDMALKVSPPNALFPGGELIELKDANNYSVSSFNSTIPSGKKEIAKVFKGGNSGIKRQMELAGDDIFSLPVRDVFYLVRGKNQKQNAQKVVLVHGSFFETVKIQDLISQSFSQVLAERLAAGDLNVPPEMKQLLETIFSEQENFSKVRTVEKASVKLRFRVMTEVKAEGNILNTAKYPEIAENSLNLVLPCHDDLELTGIRQKMSAVFSEVELADFKSFKMKHHFNGYFLVYQAKIELP